MVLEIDTPCQFGVVPILNRLKPFLAKLVPSMKTDEEDFNKICVLAKDKVEERARKGSSRTDMLAIFFIVREWRDYYTNDEIMNDSYDAV